MSGEVKQFTRKVIIPTAIRATPALFHVVPDLGAGVMIYILVSERSLFFGLLQRQWRGGRPTHHASQHRKLRRTVVVRRLKGSTDSSHYHDPTLDWVCPGQPRHGHAAAAALPRPRLDQQHGEVLERDELAGLKRLQRDGAKAAHVFVNE